MNTLRNYVEWKLTHTDKIGNEEGYPLILEKCKLNKEMKELKLYGNSLQNGIPSQDNPVEIQSVGISTVNLFNSNCKLSSRWNLSNIQATDNSVTAIVSSDVSMGFARLSVRSAAEFAGKTMFFTFNPVTENVNVTSSALMVCDSEGSIIKTSAISEKWEGGYYTSIVVPEDVSETDTLDLRMYLKDGIKGEMIKITDVMIYEGSEPLTYEPAGKYRISVEQSNLYVEGNILTKGAFSNDINCIYDQGIYTFTRTKEFPDRFSEWFDVGVPAGSDIFFRYDVIETTCVNPLKILVKYADGSDTTLTFYPYSSTYSVKMSKDVVRLRLYLEGAEAVGAYIKFKHLVVGVNERPMLEKRMYNVYLNEPLRRFGAYADYIDFKNKTVVRHMYEEVFDGTENWTLINVVDGASGFRFDLRDGGGVMASINAADNGMCNKYPVIYERDDKTCSGDATLHQIVDFIDSSFTSVDEWNAHLASEYANGTPLKFLHTLATPNVEPIECDLPVLTGDTTVFEVESTVKPSDMYGKYIKG